MKIPFLPALLVLSACSVLSGEKSRPVEGLEALLSDEDLRIHRCLHSGKDDVSVLRKTCLKGTAYEDQVLRSPSSDDEIIMKYNWFFDSRENLEKFFRASQGFLKGQARLMARNAGKLVNKSAVGVEGSVYVGVGRGWAAEFAFHQNRLGLLCSPSWSIQSDAGIEGDLFYTRTLSCQTNNDYAGEDVSFGGSISGELIALPFGVGLSYSMSIGPQSFHEKILEARNKGLLNFQSLATELAHLNSPAFRNYLARDYRHALPLLTLAMKPASLFNITPPVLVPKQSVSVFVAEMIRNDKSLALLFKQYYSRQLRQKLLAARLHNLNAFVSALESSVTGCDTISGSASLGVSLIPASVGASYSRSALIAEVGLQELATFSSITAMALLNPFLLPSQDLRTIVKVARSLVTIPQTVERLCLR